LDFMVGAVFRAKSGAERSMNDANHVGFTSRNDFDGAGARHGKSSSGSQSVAQEALLQLAVELEEMILSRMTDRAQYYRMYARHQDRSRAVRLERKRKNAQQVVLEPAKAAERKLAKQQTKKRRRKAIADGNRSHSNKTKFTKASFNPLASDQFDQE